MKPVPFNMKIRGTVDRSLINCWPSKHKLDLQNSPKALCLVILGCKSTHEEAEANSRDSPNIVSPSWWIHGSRGLSQRQWLAFLRMILEVVYCLTYRHTFVDGHENPWLQTHHHMHTEDSIKTDTLTYSILGKKWVPFTKEWNKSLSTECPWEMLHSYRQMFSSLLHFPQFL